ncbi:MAG: hypothetical protein ACK559_25590, partial [bacterium]
SAAVDKTAAPAAAGAPLAERRDHVFAGTAVVAGVGEAEVVATGMRTELGRIAAMLDEAPVPPSPLQAQLARVSRALLALCLGVVLVVALSALARMTAPRARVRRGGLDQLVPAEDVVVGDRLLLRPGDVVAADARVA